MHVERNDIRCAVPQYPPAKLRPLSRTWPIPLSRRPAHNHDTEPPRTSYRVNAAISAQEGRTFGSTPPQLLPPLLAARR